MSKRYDDDYEYKRIIFIYEKNLSLSLSFSINLIGPTFSKKIYIIKYCTHIEDYLIFKKLYIRIFLYKINIAHE